jgi:hypothetical protein
MSSIRQRVMITKSTHITGTVPPRPLTTTRIQGPRSDLVTSDSSEDTIYKHGMNTGTRFIHPLTSGQCASCTEGQELSYYNIDSRITKRVRVKRILDERKFKAYEDAFGPVDIPGWKFVRGVEVEVVA